MLRRERHPIAAAKCVAAVVLACVLVLSAACSSTSTVTSPVGTAGGPSSPAGTTALPPGTTVDDSYYVSVGDSYAAGQQATGVNQGHTTENGFAYQLAASPPHGYHFKLVNFGCSGVTTAQALNDNGCKNPGPGDPPYPDQSQTAAAEKFLNDHHGHIALVTVILGGNDVLPCAQNATPVPCVASAVDAINTSLPPLLKRLRAAAGPDVPIVGLTYVDGPLGGYISTDPGTKNLAPLTVGVFQNLINPALEKQYEAVQGTFVDVTAATGAYTPLTETTTLAPYGQIPTAVAKACELTFDCQYQDPHPTTAGYKIIADLIATTLPPRG